MKRNGQHSRSSEVAHIIAEVRRMTPEEIIETYGIQLLDDGKVLDITYDEEFKNIPEWAAWSVAEENLYNNEDLYDQSKYEDEDY
jgi:hypothetical protein